MTEIVPYTLRTQQSESRLLSRRNVSTRHLAIARRIKVHGRRISIRRITTTVLLIGVLFSAVTRAENPPTLRNTVPSTNQGFVKIVIDVNDFESNTPRGDRQWGNHNDCSGGLMAIPNLWDAHVLPEDFTQNSPELTYHVQIPTTENYVVWFHAKASDWKSNSAHFTIVHENQDANTENLLKNRLRMRIRSLRNWVWTRSTLDISTTELFEENNGSNAILKLQAGESKLHVWMDEDGFCFDKIILVNDFGYDPTEEFGSLVGKRITPSQ